MKLNNAGEDMGQGPFYITSKVSFEDVFSDQISWPQVYRNQVRSWLFEPAYKLTSNRDHWMSLLTLLLVFFEPHGQYLGGNSSKNRSMATFKTGFKPFLSFLQNRQLVHPDFTAENIEKLYVWARCGLMHSMTMEADILVDAFGLSDHIIGRFANQRFWLVQPVEMLVELEEYFENYIRDLEAPGNEDKLVPFNKTFDRLVLTPGRNLVGK